MLRPKLNRIWASTNEILRRDPGDAKYIQGWVSEIPTYQVLNFLQYKIDTTLLALAERGVFEWGGDVQYQMGSIAWDSGTVYISTVGNPDKTKSPKDNPSQWSASSIQIPRASFDSLVSAVNKHIEDLNNPHNVSAATINAYTKDEINNIVAQYNALVKAHVDDKDNPHKVTATQVGAVPVTGGTYTGQVTFAATDVFFSESKDTLLWSSGGDVKIVGGGSTIGLVGGVPKAGVNRAETPIILESNFKSYKQTNEPDYAVPQPIFHLPISRNICPSIGYSKMTYTGGPSDTPEYDPFDGGLILKSNISPMLLSSQPLNLSEYTLSYEALPSTEPGPTNIAYSLIVAFRDANGSDGDGAYKVRMYSRIYASNQVDMAVVNGAQDWVLAVPNVPLVVNKYAKLTFVFRTNMFRMFMDGKLIGYKALTNVPPIDARYLNAAARIGIGDFARDWKLRNIRIWNSALTDEQVSTL